MSFSLLAENRGSNQFLIGYFKTDSFVEVKPGTDCSDVWIKKLYGIKYVALICFLFLFAVILLPA